MRIDKYLKVSRITKRRETAKALAEAGMVKVNGKTAKPQTDVKAGDELVIDLGRRRLFLTVSETREYASKSDAPNMYRIQREEAIKEESDEIQTD